MKGYQRKVIFLKNTGSPYFDEAYFVVSREGACASVEQSDMVLEANRIIESSLEDSALRIRRERVKKFRDFLIPFFLGMLISVLLTFFVNSLCKIF